MPRQPGLGVLTEGHRLAVWGDPIDHSRSPAIHAAAYAVLGLDWEYGRRRVAEPDFASTLASLDDTWRGLSVTFPLKSAAHAASIALDRRAQLTGAVNTLLLGRDGPRGFNTDIGGIVAALREEGPAAVARARIIGAGATSTSALVALAELGVREVDVVARRPEAAAALEDLGDELGLTVRASPFEGAPPRPVAVTIATLPGEARIPEDTAAALAETGGFLLDVVYGQWPTALASAWERAGNRPTSGLGMLLHQAVLQVRISLTGDPDEALDDEPAVIDAMRRAVVGD